MVLTVPGVALRSVFALPFTTPYRPHRLLHRVDGIAYDDGDGGGVGEGFIQYSL